MLIKSIKLNNIRSYTEQTIDFPEGSTLLMGDIGSGKTTILLAMEFALFGIIKSDLTGESLLRNGQKEGSVELKLILDAQEITIRRALKKNKDTITQDAGHIIINNKKTDLTPVELKSKILELLGYPQESINKKSLVYRYTVYTPQEDMKSILFESNEERLDTLRKIFNIDKYKRIRENSLMYAKELRTLKKIYEVKIQDLEQLKNSLTEKIQQLEIIKSKISEQNNSYETIKSQLDKKTLEIKELEDKIKELNELKKQLEISIINTKNKKFESEKNKKELNMAEFRINEYNIKLSELGVIDKNEEELRVLVQDSEEKLNKINSAKEIINKRLEDKQEDLDKAIIEDFASLNARQGTILRKLEAKESKEELFDKYTKDFNAIALEMNSLKLLKSHSEKIITQMKDLDECPTCLQRVDFSHKVKISDKESSNILVIERKMKEYESKTSELTKHISEIKSEIEELRKDELALNEIKFKLQQVLERKALRDSLEKEIEELKQKKEKLDAMDVNKLIDVISKNRKILNNIAVKKHIEDSLKEKTSKKEELTGIIAKTDEELKKLNENSEEISKKILEFAETEKDFNTKKQEFEIINKELRQAEILLVSMKKDQEIFAREIKQLNENIEIKLKLKEKINYLNDMNFWITEHFINLTSTIEKSIMQKIHMEFNELFRKWFEILMDDEAFDVRIDENFTPKILQNGFDIEVANLSGGEKTSIALAYRLALNRVINDFINNIKTKDLIILDEPTDGFSSEQLDKMKDVLEELNVKQTIIVSHEAKMESYVQNIVRVAKNEHESKITP